jgi:hypothetical protein
MPVGEAERDLVSRVQGAVGEAERLAVLAGERPHLGQPPARGPGFPSEPQDCREFPGIPES